MKNTENGNQRQNQSYTKPHSKLRTTKSPKSPHQAAKTQVQLVSPRRATNHKTNKHNKQKNTESKGNPKKNTSQIDHPIYKHKTIEIQQKCYTEQEVMRVARELKQKGGVFDSYKQHKRLNKLLDNISEWNIPTANKQKLLYLIRKSQAEGLSTSQQVKYLEHGGWFFKWLEKHYPSTVMDQINEDMMIHCLLNIKNTPTKKGKLPRGQTIRTRYNTIQAILNQLGCRQVTVNIKPKIPREPSVQSKDLPNIDEIRAIIRHSPNIMYKAAYSIHYESGCRPGELLSLRISDLEDIPEGMIINTHGKTGHNPYFIRRSVAYLREWVEVHHPEKTNPDAPVWIGYDNQPLTYEAYRLNLVQTAKAAGVEKRIYPRIFRHREVTENKERGTPDDVLNYMMGWGPDSRMASNYTHLDRHQRVKQILKYKYGVDDPTPQPTQPTHANELSQAILTLVNTLIASQRPTQNEPMDLVWTGGQKQIIETTQREKEYNRLYKEVLISQQHRKLTDYLEVEE